MKTSKISGIYKILNVITQKYYIGSSITIYSRWNEHRSGLNRNKHGNKRLQNSWNKHSSAAFEFIILEECLPSDVLIREQHYLNTLQPYKKDIGYNLNADASGGDFYSLLTDDQKREFIKKCKRVGKDNGMYGKTHTDETKQKQKEKAKNRFTLDWFTDKYGKEKGKLEFDTRRSNLSSRNINHVYDNKLKGIKRGAMSEENKNKISESRKRIKLIEPQIREAIISQLYTIKQLEEMFSISKPTVLDRKRKYLDK